MRVLWTLLKVALALALVIPVSIIVLATALGVLGAVFGLAVLTLRIAVVGLIVWGVFRLITRLFGGDASRAQPQEIKELAKVDPHYEAAMRELDRELGHVGR
jgi:small-conductance mechanosensitive channel